MKFSMFFTGRETEKMPKEADKQKMSYSYNFLINLNTKVLGVDDEITPHKYQIGFAFDAFSDRFDTPPDFLLSEFAMNYLKRYWEGKTLLNSADETGVATCAFRDLNYRFMVPVEKKFRNPTCENIGLELFFCIKKLVEYFDFKFAALSIGENHIYRSITALDQKHNEAYRNSLLARWVETFYFCAMNKVNLRNRDNA